MLCHIETFDKCIGLQCVVAKYNLHLKFVVPQELCWSDIRIFVEQAAMMYT